LAWFFCADCAALSAVARAGAAAWIGAVAVAKAAGSPGTEAVSIERVISAPASAAATRLSRPPPIHSERGTPRLGEDAVGITTEELRMRNFLKQREGARYNAANPVGATTTASDLLRLVRRGKARMRTLRPRRPFNGLGFRRKRKSPHSAGLGLRWNRLLGLAPEICSGQAEELLKCGWQIIGAVLNDFESVLQIHRRAKVALGTFPP
jgi:hypothetical protein